MSSIIIIGAGLSGLSAAIRLAEKNIPSFLISAQPSTPPLTLWARATLPHSTLPIP